MQMRTTCTIALLSVASTFFVIFHAFYQKRQFYPSVVYLTKSNTSLAVLYAQALVMVYLVAQIVRKIFFGQLRAVESEHLSERAWYAITETCLAFTVFRDDFSPRFVAQFTLLLVLKCFHWLAEERVDYMERSPLITILFHCRLMSVIAFLSTLDSYFMSHAYFTTLLRGASVQIVFGFEYAILMTIIFHIAVKYILHSIDSRNVHPWENKAVYLLYAELVIGLMRVVLYTVFVMVMIRLHTFPLFSIRPMYLTLRSFKKALNDIFMSRRAINYLNHVFPDATEEDLSQTDTVCIICREEMTRGQAKKLPCNHIFHAACLRSWFQRQQTCPTCRMDIIQAANNVLLNTGAVQRNGTVIPGQPQNNNLPNGTTVPVPPAQNLNAQQQQQQQAIQNPAQFANFPGGFAAAFPHLQQQQQPMMIPQNMQIPGFNPFGLLAPGGQPLAAVPPAAGPATADGTGQQPGTSSAGTASFGGTTGITGQTVTANVGGTGTTANSAGINNPQPFSFFPLPPPPPFCMPHPTVTNNIPPAPMPFLLPFPSPPNFTGLTDDEVRRMERDDRQGVEARVQALRNIQTLLDAAVVQLQQYLSIMPIATMSSALGGAQQQQAPSSTSGVQQQQAPNSSGAQQRQASSSSGDGGGGGERNSNPIGQTSPGAADQSAKTSSTNATATTSSSLTNASGGVLGNSKTANSRLLSSLSSSSIDQPSPSSAPNPEKSTTTTDTTTTTTG